MLHAAPRTANGGSLTVGHRSIEPRHAVTWSRPGAGQRRRCKAGLPRAAPRLLGQLWGGAAPAAPAEAGNKTKRARLAELETEPAPTDVWAESLANDSEDVAPLRQLLAATRLERAPLALAFDADRDGWSADAFHQAVDGRGAALVVALTAGGAVLGGYNPSGWSGGGAERSDIAAFLFVWPEGDLSARPIKLPKVGGPEQSVVRDAPGEGIWLGPDGLAVPLQPGAERVARSKLGAYFARRPNGGRHLFSEGSPVRGGARATQLVSLRVYVGEGGDV